MLSHTFGWQLPSMGLCCVLSHCLLKQVLHRLLPPGPKKRDPSQNRKNSVTSSKWHEHLEITQFWKAQQIVWIELGAIKTKKQVSVDLRVKTCKLCQQKAHRLPEKNSRVGPKGKGRKHQATVRCGDFRSLQSWMIVTTKIGALTKKKQNHKPDDHTGRFRKPLRAVDSWTKVGIEPGLETATCVAINWKTMKSTVVHIICLTVALKEVPFQLSVLFRAQWMIGILLLKGRLST